MHLAVPGAVPGLIPCLSGSFAPVFCQEFIGSADG